MEAELRETRQAAPFQRSPGGQHHGFLAQTFSPRRPRLRGFPLPGPRLHAHRVAGRHRHHRDSRLDRGRFHHPQVAAGHPSPGHGRNAHGPDRDRVLQGGLWNISSGQPDGDQFIFHLESPPLGWFAAIVLRVERLPLNQAPRTGPPPELTVRIKPSSAGPTHSTYFGLAAPRTPLRPTCGVI